MVNVSLHRSAKPTTLRQSLPGLRRALHYVRPELHAERRLLAGGFLALLAEVGFRLVQPWPLKFVIDGVVAAGAGAAPGLPAGVGTVIALSSLAVVAAAAMRAGTAYLSTLTFALAGNRLLTAVRGRLYAHLQTLGMSFHDKARTGDLVTRMTSDVGRLKEVAITAALPLFGNTVTLVGMLVVVAVLDWQLALAMLVVFPLFWVTSLRMSRKIHGVSRTQRRAEGALAATAAETFGAMQVVQSYGLEEHNQRHFDSSNTKSLRDGVQSKRLSAGLERRTDVLVGLATGLVLYLGAQRVLAGALSPGELVVFLTYLKAAFKPMRDLAKYTGRIAQAAASAERIVDIFQTEPDVRDTPWVRPARRFYGDVRLEDVWLAYEPGRYALQGLDLTVHPGERVALVGPSGAGKSTLVMLLSRLRDPDRGVVRIDGHDLRTLTLRSVRSQVAIVLQESVLFAASIRDNITAGLADIDQDDVESAARVAGAHEFICDLPDGYDTVVGERGATLSGGQRQRIAIARAAIRDAPIVVLDEPLTGLDEDTAHEVAGALDRLTEGRTTFVITHDPAAAADCDRVVWLEHGRVAEVDGPASASARRSDAYAR